MPIKSMTGYARVQVRVEDGGREQLSYTLSLKSVLREGVQPLPAK